MGGYLSRTLNLKPLKQALMTAVSEQPTTKLNNQNNATFVMD
jgi:hypothetical protein